jgi:hypothetical protein
MIYEIFNIFTAVVPVADFAVVHERPVLPRKRMAVASVDCCTSGGNGSNRKGMATKHELTLCSEPSEMLL